MSQKPNWSDLLLIDEQHGLPNLDDDDDDDDHINRFVNQPEPDKNKEEDSSPSPSPFKPGWLYMKKNPWGPGILFQPGPPSNRFPLTKNNKPNQYEKETKRNQALFRYRIALEQYQMDSLNECLGDLSPYWNFPPALEKYDAYEDFVASTSRPKRKIKNITT